MSLSSDRSEAPSQRPKRDKLLERIVADPHFREQLNPANLLRTQRTPAYRTPGQVLEKDHALAAAEDDSSPECPSRRQKVLSCLPSLAQGQLRGQRRHCEVRFQKRKKEREEKAEKRRQMEKAGMAYKKPWLLREKLEKYDFDTARRKKWQVKECMRFAEKKVNETLKSEGFRAARGLLRKCLQGKGKWEIDVGKCMILMREE